MFGYLTPCDGGPPIGLSKVKLVLRLRTQNPDPSITGGEGHAELHFADGLWSVESPAGGPRLQINDKPCDQGRLMPDDVLTVGRHRYRISYRLPQASVPESVATAPSTTVAAPPAPAPRPVAARPVDAPVLGMLIPCAGGRPIMLRKAKVVLGRATDCDVVVAHRIVSSRHCVLDFNSGYWQAVDLDSRNGTFVDGMRYRVKWVFPGNILGLSTQRFRVEYVAYGERPCTRDDDVPVLSQKSLLERVGLTEQKLDSLSKEHEEPVRQRWRIDDV